VRRADYKKMTGEMIKDMNKKYLGYVTQGMKLVVTMTIDGGCFNGNGSPSITNSNKGGSTSGAASAMVASAAMLAAVAALFA